MLVNQVQMVLQVMVAQAVLVVLEEQQEIQVPKVILDNQAPLELVVLEVQVVLLVTQVLKER